MNSNQNSRQNNRSGRHNHKQNNRGRNQGGRGGGGGRKGQSKKQSHQPLTATRQVDSYGPAGKLRGNVQQLYEKYMALDYETRTKDRTTAEAYGQYAHHYFTIYSEFAEAEAAQLLEREKEKERQQKQAVDNQSNIVPMADSDTSEDKKDETPVKNDKKPVEEKTEKPKREKAEEPSPDLVPELPLEAAKEEKPVKRTRKPRKAKEEVAE